MAWLRETVDEAAIVPCTDSQQRRRGRLNTPTDSAAGTASGSGKLEWLQSLRGLAAMMVVMFHAAPHWNTHPRLAPLAGLLHWGFSGVDIFFVLSGFVVYRSAKSSIPATGVGAFVARRVARIYGGYWPALLFIAVVGRMLFDTPWPAAEKMIFSALLLYPSTFDNWLPVAWSLTFELYFCLWTAVVFVCFKRRRNLVLTVAIFILVAWNATWLVAAPELAYAERLPLRHWFTGLGIEFLAGALVAEAYDRKMLHQVDWRALALIGASLALVGYANGAMSTWFNRIEILRAGSYGIAGLGLLLIALALHLSALRPPTWSVVLGDASFSLYLLHNFFLDASAHLRLEVLHQASRPTFFLLLLAPVLFALASMLWYRLIEQPVQRSLARRMPVLGRSMAKTTTPR
jgi:exopolysaccharide production protein ExoZ